MKNTVRVAYSYGDLKPGFDYKVLNEGRDFVVVRAKGSLVYLPLHLIERPEDRVVKYVEERDEEYEESFAYDRVRR